MGTLAMRDIANAESTTSGHSDIPTYRDPPRPRAMEVKDKGMEERATAATELKREQSF